MRRFSLAIVVTILVLSLTAASVVAGMRVNRVVFTAIGSTSDTTLARASTGASADAVENGGTVCSASSPCIGLALNAQGILTGISAQIADAAVVHLIAQGVPIDVTCSNKGGNEAPGQNPAPITATGEQLITSADITKRGTAPLDLTATFGSLSFPGNRMGCPNGNWTATVHAVRFTCATIEVTQGTTLILRQVYDLDGTCAEVAG